MSASAEFVSVPVEMLGDVWPLALPHVERAMARTGGEYSPADVLVACQGAQAQLWVSVLGGEITGALVTRVVTYPQFRVCELWLCGGEWDEAWSAFLGMIEDWARSVGCRAVRVYGRRGWIRKLRYTERCTVAERWL